MPIEMNGVNTNVDDGLAPSTASQVMLHSRTSYFIPMEGVSASLQSLDPLGISVH